MLALPMCSPRRLWVRLGAPALCASSRSVSFQFGALEQIQLRPGRKTSLRLSGVYSTTARVKPSWSTLGVLVGYDGVLEF